MCNYITSNSLPEGWRFAEVTFRRTNGEERRRIEIISGYDRYLNEPLTSTALKCFILFAIGCPAYFIAYTAVSLIRLVTVPIANLSMHAAVKELWHIVKIPFCFLWIEFAALYGVFRPLEGRALFGNIESELHGGKTRREAEQYLKQERTDGELLWDAFIEENPRRALFIGFCMQPIGRVDDPHIIRVQRLQNQSAV